MTTFKKGDIVLYSPIMLPGEPRFIGVVRKEPWKLDSGGWVTHLTGLPKEYGDFVQSPGRAYVHAARFEALELAPTIYCNGAWRKRSARDNERVDHEVFYVLPVVAGSLDFPHVPRWTCQAYVLPGLAGVPDSPHMPRWMWQAGSECGSSESYEAALAKVEELWKLRKLK